jgi:hypothetical protein
VGFYGESPEQPVAVTSLGAEDLTIASKSYPCRVEQVETTSATSKTVTKLWRTDEVAPFVLKRETVTTMLETGAKSDESSMEVVSLGRRRTIRERLRAAVELRLVHRHARGKTVTLAWECDDVPGGIVEQNAEEFDGNDRLVRRTKLELVDYKAK